MFAEQAIVGTEGGEKVGVDIEFTGNFAVMKDGDDDFGFGFEGTGEIARIVGDVVDDDGLAGAGRGTADALIERDASVGSHGALERAEDECGVIGVFPKHVEADPIVFGELAVKEGDDVLHQGLCGKGCDGERVEFGNEVGGFRMCGGHDRSVEHKWRRGAKWNGGRGDGRVKERGIAGGAEEEVYCEDGAKVN